jgi:hypothetical protein
MLVHLVGLLDLSGEQCPDVPWTCADSGRALGGPGRVVDGQAATSR